MIAKDALWMLAPKVIATLEPLNNCSPAIPDSQKYGTIFSHCWQINMQP